MTTRDAMPHEFYAPELSAEEYARRLMQIAAQISQPYKTGVPAELQRVLDQMGFHIALETISSALMMAPQAELTQDLYRETIGAQGDINESILASMDQHPQGEELLAKRLRALRERYSRPDRTSDHRR